MQEKEWTMKKFRLHSFIHSFSLSQTLHVIKDGFRGSRREGNTYRKGIETVCVCVCVRARRREREDDARRVKNGSRRSRCRRRWSTTLFGFHKGFVLLVFWGKQKGRRRRERERESVG